MINSWADLIYALERMRKLQKDPNTQKSLERRFQLAGVESDVDACVASKVFELAARRQPGLLEEEAKDG
jgi:hypothetical protein